MSHVDLIGKKFEVNHMYGNFQQFRLKYSMNIKFTLNILTKLSHKVIMAHVENFLILLLRVTY